MRRDLSMLNFVAKVAPFLSYPLALLERRKDWFIDNPSPRKMANLALAGASFALKRERAHHWPVALKIDLSPVCNLSCTVCVHASPIETSNDELKSQQFNAKQMMTVEQFRRIVDEVKGKTAALSLYYLGDPFVHPQLDEMCRIASDAGLNTHVSSNFSFKFSDARIRSIVESGVTHLTACVDGLSQETYSRTRVGGRIDKVIDNLVRVLRVRKELGRENDMRVEVQFIKFQHNVHELEAARKRFIELGLDQFTDFWGNLNNYTDALPGKFDVYGPKKNGRSPQCHWPHFSMTIKYNGDAIPCCEYRHGQQYTDKPEEARAVGNVFASSVWDVWTSKEYDKLRRLVSNPERAKEEAALKNTFCEGCHLVYDTDFGKVQKNGDRVAWEDIYEKDAKGRVVRKPETELHFEGGKKRRLTIVDNSFADSE